MEAAGTGAVRLARPHAPSTTAATCPRTSCPAARSTCRCVRAQLSDLSRACCLQACTHAHRGTIASPCQWQGRSAVRGEAQARVPGMIWVCAACVSRELAGVVRLGM